MATIPFALALVLALPAQEDAEETMAVVETWDELAGAYERAFVAWVEEMSASGGWQKPAAEQPPAPQSKFWPRFEMLSALGEPRATVWLIEQLDHEEQRTEHGAILFERVRDARGAAWVARALPALVEERDALPEGALAPYLAELLTTVEERDVRVAALLASAAIEPDRARSEELSLRAAALHWRGVEPKKQERVEGAQLAELAAALVDGLDKEESAWHRANFFEGEDKTWYPHADCAPQPTNTWRPVVEILAARGDPQACVWSLTNSISVEEQAAALREKLDVLSRAEIADKLVMELPWYVSSWIRQLGLEFVEPRVRAIAERAGDEAQAKLLVGLGDGICKNAADDAVRERGLAVLREVQARWPDSEQGRRAAGKLFRHTNLVVGKPVPDFQALDPDGNAIKLSEQHGKVTVVVFWGFW